MKKPKKVNINDMQDKLNRNLSELNSTIGSFRKYIHNWEFTVKENFPAMAGVGKPRLGQRYIDVFYSGWGIDMLKDDEIKGVTIHEILHIYNNHFGRMEEGIKDVSIKIPKFGYQPSLWNVATDLAINFSIDNYFKNFKVKLPKGCLSTSLFPQDIRNKIEDMPAEHIFNVLKKKYEEDTKKFEKMMEDILDKMIKDGHQPQQQQQQQGQGQQQGKGKGSPSPNGGGGQKPNNMNFDDHSNMKEATMSVKDGKETDKQVQGNKDAKKDSADVKGKDKIGSQWNHSKGDPLDYTIKNMAIEYYTSVKMGRILKSIRSKVIANASSLRPQTNYSYKKHSRRKYSASRKYGAIYKGKSKIMKNKDLIVALDTSGSVSDSDIETALKVINGFMVDWKFNIYLIQCDNEIREVKYFTHQIRNINVKGRGGTDYQCVFDYVNKRWVKQGNEDPRQMMLVYIGDGETEYKIDNHKINTVWLFNTKYWDEFYKEIKFGEKFVIPETAKERKNDRGEYHDSDENKW